MDRTRLLAEIAQAGPGPEDVLYLERRGGDYQWRCLEPHEMPAAGPGPGSAPDAWIFYSGPWPSARPGDLPEFLDDLLAEMESMCGGADRCRWPLDQPYPAGH